MPIFWRLKYSQQVVSTLYRLRERGHELHNRIKALKFKAFPWEGATAVQGRPHRFEIRVDDLIVGFEESQEAEDTEPTLRILYIDMDGVS